MKCPFYNSKCITRDCAAFEVQEYTNVGGKDESAYWAYRAEMEHLIKKRAYCHALKKELPVAVYKTRG